MAAPARVLTLDELRQLCREFDKEHWSYPEHQWEGWAFWQYVEQQFGGTAIDLDYDPPEDWFFAEEG